jgi:hypothetical protein
MPIRTIYAGAGFSEEAADKIVAYFGGSNPLIFYTQVERESFRKALIEGAGVCYGLTCFSDQIDYRRYIIVLPPLHGAVPQVMIAENGWISFHMGLSDLISQYGMGNARRHLSGATYFCASGSDGEAVRILVHMGQSFHGISLEDKVLMYDQGIVEIDIAAILSN